MCGQCLISHNIIVYGRLTFIDSFLVIKNPRILWSRAIFGFPHRLISGYIIINNWKDIVNATRQWVRHQSCSSCLELYITSWDGKSTRSEVNGTLPIMKCSIHHFHLLCSKMEYVVVRQCIPITATMKPLLFLLIITAPLNWKERTFIVCSSYFFCLVTVLFDTCVEHVYSR